MNYYYDIKLNFLKENSFFYDWLETDNIEKIKKIPIFQVTKKVFKEFYMNEIKVNEEFLNMINDDTIKNNGKIKYACIIADKNNAYAYKFNNEGIIIGRSSLNLIDELNILEYLYAIKNINIKYSIIDKITFNKDLRYINKINNIIDKEIDVLYKKKNIAKLRYLYLEWFNENENNIDKIYKKMKNKIKNFQNEDLRIYDLIKMSYHNV